MSQENQNPAGKPPEWPSNVPASAMAPPLIPARSTVMPPPGSNPLEQAPITGVISAVEALLRQPRRVMYQLKQPNAGRVIWSLLAIAIVCSLVYGVIVGTFSEGSQLWAAPVKITAGLLISAVICLPSLYIFSCLSGAQARLVEVFGLVAGLLALMTVLLIGFAPVAWVFSQSTRSIVVMGFLHLVFWLVGTIFGLRFLKSGFKHFNARSNAGLAVWVIVFLLVALQMTTALRPIVGKSDRFLPKTDDKQFFATYWMNCVNAEGDTNSAGNDRT